MIRALYDEKKKVMHTIHRAYVKADFSMERCIYCTDLLNVYCDISFGDNNTKTKDGESCTVVVRSDLGTEIMGKCEKQDMFFRENISVTDIKDIKDRRKREYFEKIYSNENQSKSIYPDRKEVEESVWKSYEESYHKAIRKRAWALKKRNLKLLWCMNQLKYYKLKLFNKKYLSELPRKANGNEDAE